MFFIVQLQEFILLAKSFSQFFLLTNQYPLGPHAHQCPTRLIRSYSLNYCQVHSQEYHWRPHCCVCHTEPNHYDLIQVWQLCFYSMRLGKINDHSGNQAYYYINRKEILCTLRIWMLASLNRSCLATSRSPPQWPCFYATEKRNFSCLIGACIYQDLWECVILMRVNLVQKDTEIVPRYNLPKNTDIIKYFCRHQQNYKKIWL